jgi:hypothetical protein
VLADALRLLSPAVTVEDRVEPFLEVFRAELPLTEGADVPPTAFAAGDPADAGAVPLRHEGSVPEVPLKVVPLLAAFPARADRFVSVDVVRVRLAEATGAVLAHVRSRFRTPGKESAHLAANVGSRAPVQRG